MVVEGGSTSLTSEHRPGNMGLQLVDGGHWVQAGPMLYMGALITLPASP